MLKSYHPQVSNHTNGDKFLYRTASPAKMIKGEKYPLLIFFHGAGGRGEDNKKQLLDARGIENFEKNKIRTKYQSHIIAGQVPHGENGLMLPGLYSDIKCLRFLIRSEWPSRL